jgi:hypothetical protein
MPCDVGVFPFSKIKAQPTIGIFSQVVSLGRFFMGLWIISRGLGFGIPYFSPHRNTLEVKIVETIENCIHQASPTSPKKSCPEAAFNPLFGLMLKFFFSFF